jgi:hypothetical protein
MEPITLIADRRRKIEAEMADLTEHMAALKSELVELDTAGRVLARLSGTSWPPAPQRVDGDDTEDSGKPNDLPTVPDMILAVLGTAKGSGLRGMEPKTITAQIAEGWWPDVKGPHISSVVWRMWKAGRLAKDGAIYMLPDMNEPPDGKSATDTSEGSIHQPEAQGREAVSGHGAP